MDARVYRNLLVSFYDAALGETHWNESLAMLGQLLSSPVVVLFSQIAGQSRSTFFGGVGLQPKTVQQYVDYFGARNVLMSEGASLHREGLARTSETICPPDVLLGSEYYNDFMRPVDIRYSAALTALRDEEHAIHLSAFREHRASPFDERDLGVLSEVHPHLRRALQVHLQLADSEQRRTTLEQVLGGARKGIAFLNAMGKAVYINPTLQDILESRDGLLLSRDGITALEKPAAMALRAAIDEAGQGADGGVVDIPRPSDRHPYAVVVSPVWRTIGVVGCAQATTLLVVTDPERSGAATVGTLRRRYGLTPMEARVASSFMSGADTAEIAGRLNVSIHTARTHLKRIMAKTNTSRQTELMRRLLIELT